MERRLIIDRSRFHRTEDHVYILQGYFEGNSIAGSRVEAYLGKEKLSVSYAQREGLSVRRRYYAQGGAKENINREYDFFITLPEGYEQKKRRCLKVVQILDNHKRTVFCRSAFRLSAQKKAPDYALEEIYREGDELVLRGWCVGNSPCRLQILDRESRKMPIRVKWFYRQDIIDFYPELKMGMIPDEALFAFELRYQEPAFSPMTMIIAADMQKAVVRFSPDKLIERAETGKPLVYSAGRRVRSTGTWRSCIKAWMDRSTAEDETRSYMLWRKAAQPSREELRAQRRNEFLQRPLISIVVPLYHTPENYLRELVNSVRHQTYKHWQLILSDGSGGNSELAGLLKELSAQDHRVRVLSQSRALGISANTNAAAEVAAGDYLLFMDHDDLLPEFALYEFVRQINENPDLDLIYGDDDQVGPDGKEFSHPHFKPDFSPDLLCSVNYIAHPVLLRRSLWEQTGGMDSAFDGASDYDFLLRCCEETDRICHIPQVLYHWRRHAEEGRQEKQLRENNELAMEALQAHYDRIGVAAQVSMGQHAGLYRTTCLLPEEHPLVSVIIPNRDHADHLKMCLESIWEKSAYDRLEFIIVENGSQQERTFHCYEVLQSAHPDVHVLTWNGAFNYAEINNYALNAANGEYLLFLNNDTVMIEPHTIEELLGTCMREDVGAVGARLYYGDNCIQHAGIILGMGGIAGYAFQGMPRSANGYADRIVCQSNVSAVSGACMMVKRSDFERLEGFDPTFSLAYADIDFCLRLGRLGKKVIYNPYAELYHFEAQTTGQNISPDGIAARTAQADELMRTWPDIFVGGDPYYNPNLALDSRDFQLKKR